MRRYRSYLAIVAALSTPAAVAHAYITAPSTTFTYQYNGNEIWDGTGFLDHWSQAGGATSASLSLNGVALVQTNDANNGWVQQDDANSSPWETGVGAFSIEASVKLNDNDLDLNDNIALWLEGQGHRQIIVITASAVHAWGGE